MTFDKTIDFMSKRHWAAIFSGVLLLASIVSIGVRGLNWGLDFTGGTLVELRYDRAPDTERVRQRLAEVGYTGVSVVQFGSDRDLLVRLQSDSAELDEEGRAVNVGDNIVNHLRALDEGVRIDVVRSEIIGAQIGEELATNGGLGLLVALAVVFMYVAVRFQTKFSVGAIGALAHDVIIVVGVFSILQLEFDLTVLAAVLAVIGYSLNDTIVVADRIRENFRIIRVGSSEEIINESLTQVLGRTIMTSGTTLLVLFALFFLGGELIHNFSTALLIGVAVGTYSSIYVAASIMVWMNLSKEDLMPPEKEGAELDELP